LLRAIFSHNTIASRVTNFTPFKLMFREEAVTPEEIKFRSARRATEVVTCLTEQNSKDSKQRRT
jgi:hypothetical protein